MLPLGQGEHLQSTLRVVAAAVAAALLHPQTQRYPLLAALRTGLLTHPSGGPGSAPPVRARRPRASARRPTSATAAPAWCAGLVQVVQTDPRAGLKQQCTEAPPLRSCCALCSPFSHLSLTQTLCKQRLTSVGRGHASKRARIKQLLPSCRVSCSRRGARRERTGVGQEKQGGECERGVYLAERCGRTLGQVVIRLSYEIQGRRGAKQEGLAAGRRKKRGEGGGAGAFKLQWSDQLGTRGGAQRRGGRGGVQRWRGEPVSWRGHSRTWGRRQT